MANLVITKTGFTVKVEFNDYAEKVGLDKDSFRRNEIAEVRETYNADHLTVVMLNGEEFDLSYTTHPYAMVVDSIDGVAPTSNDDLFNKLEALQQV